MVAHPSKRFKQAGLSLQLLELFEGTIPTNLPPVKHFQRQSDEEKRALKTSCRR